MACEYCHGEGLHFSGCPNYLPAKTKYYCSICGEGIQDGEEYIENDDDYAHIECFDSINELLDWFGCEIRIMEGNLDYD